MNQMHDESRSSKRGKQLDPATQLAEGVQAMEGEHDAHESEPGLPILAVRPRVAARMLGVSERKLWEITADRTSGIPHVKFGGCVLYPVDDLKRWLSELAERQQRRR